MQEKNEKNKLKRNTMESIITMYEPIQSWAQNEQRRAPNKGWIPEEESYQAVAKHQGKTLMCENVEQKNLAKIRQ